MNLGQKNTNKEWFKKGYVCFMFILVALGFQQYLLLDLLVPPPSGHH